MQLPEKSWNISNIRDQFIDNYDEVAVINFLQKKFLNYELLDQDASGNKFVFVKDIGEKLKEGGRYHNSNDGGDIHTDAPQYEKQPKTLVLYCISQAQEGGESILCNGYDLYNFLLSKGYKSEELTALVPYEQRPSGKITWGNIFSFDERGVFKVRYLRSYIDSAMKVTGYHNSNLVDLMTDIDIYLNDPKNQFIFKLKEGDLILIDNGYFLHGRKSFVTDKDHPRSLVRFWVDA